MDSILTSIKKMLGIAEEYEHFDIDIIIHINSVFATLYQIGVGPPEGFSISDKTAVWSELLGDDPRLAFVKSYVYMKVKLLFDPPPSGVAVDALNRQIDELAWRINISEEVNGAIT